MIRGDLQRWNGPQFRCFGVAHLLLLCLLLLFAVQAKAMREQDLPPTGEQPTVMSPNGRVTRLYDESHALLISESSYLGTARGGWRPLPSTESELDQVADELRAHGFQVRRVKDATGDELFGVFRKFIAQYGRTVNSRILVLYSGHGYTTKSNFGYLVPIDATDPEVNMSDFVDKALPIRQLDLWAREIESRHALFMFDSCFSGTIFNSKSIVAHPDPRGATTDDRWRFLTGKSSQPVRQYLSAGDANEMLPATSQFIPVLLQALRHGVGSNQDGYVTGKELGLWIEQTLPGLTGGRQNPHSDVIQDSALAFGDMVFELPSFRAAGSNRTLGVGNPGAGTIPSETRSQPGVIPVAGTEADYWQLLQTASTADSALAIATEMKQRFPNSPYRGWFDQAMEGAARGRVLLNGNEIEVGPYELSQISEYVRYSASILQNPRRLHLRNLEVRFRQRPRDGADEGEITELMQILAANLASFCGKVEAGDNMGDVNCVPLRFTRINGQAVLKMDEFDLALPEGAERNWRSLQVWLYALPRNAASGVGGGFYPTYIAPTPDALRQAGTP